MQRARQIRILEAGAGLTVSCGLVALVLHRYPPASWEVGGVGCIQLLFPVAMWTFFFVLILTRQRSQEPGAVLIELGRARRGQIWLAVCFSVLVLAQVGLLIWLWRLPQPDRRGSQVIESLFWVWIWVIWALQEWTVALARTRITERGILHGASLLAWEAVEGYEWIGAAGSTPSTGSTLRLRLKKAGGTLWGRVKVTYHIPEVHTETLNALLNKYIRSEPIRQ